MESLRVEQEDGAVVSRQLCPKEGKGAARILEILEKKGLKGYLQRDGFDLDGDDLVYPGVITFVPAVSDNDPRSKRQKLGMKFIPKNMPIMDGKLTSRVSRLERGSKCIGTAIRLSKKGIIMTTKLAKDDMENVKEITAFGGSLVLIQDNPYKFCFFKGEEGEAFDIAPFLTFGATHEVDLVSYPLQRIRNKHSEVSKGVVEDIDPTGYYGTLTLAKSKEGFPFGGAVVVGEKLLLGMHIGTSGTFITSWMIRHFLGEFDKRYDEPIKVPLVRRSRKFTLS